MCVSQNNNRLFLALVFGILFASGCSGHSVKYGANSEGDGMVSGEEEMTASDNGVSHSSTQYSDGSVIDGGTVDGHYPYVQSDKGIGKTSDKMSSDMAGIDGSSSVPRNGSDYGQQFGGVDGSGPNHGSVTGFGSGSAKATNPDPETWANAYLREKRSSPEFYGNPSGNDKTVGSSSYGHDYAGVPRSGPKHGAIDGFSQGSASQTEASPENWAQAYLHENGGPSPEYVDPEGDIVQANGKKDSSSMTVRDSGGELVEMNHATGSSDGSVQDIYFAFDSWSISPEGARYLEEDAKWLQAHPDKFLTIEGHCDQRGTQDYNLILGKKRAEAARDYLVNLGIQPHRINIVSYGKERPFCQNNNEHCFQENRRNHMVVRVNQS